MDIKIADLTNDQLVAIERHAHALRAEATRDAFRAIARGVRTAGAAVAHGVARIAHKPAAKAA